MVKTKGAGCRLFCSTKNERAWRAHFYFENLGQGALLQLHSTKSVTVPGTLLCRLLAPIFVADQIGGREAQIYSNPETTGGITLCFN